MPQEKTHTKINLLAIISLIILVLYDIHYLPPGFIPFIIGFITSTLFLSPDIDIPQSTISKRWGYARIIWLPYQTLFKHRGISHNILLGPLSRIIYIAGFFALFSFTFSIIIPSLPINLLYITLGIYTADLLHVTLDKIF